MEKYDVFISYRRDGGDQSAKVIYDKLKEMGYKVFLDVETLRSGQFNTKLYNVIEECKDILVILSPGALDRCVNEDDWVRLEIAHALRCKKNIVPVLLRGFQFPAELPEDIDKLRFQSGVSASVEFFDAFIAKLQSFLTGKPAFGRKIKSSLSWRRVLVAVACCLVIAVGAWAAVVLIGQASHGAGAFPATQKEKNEVRDFLYNVQTNLAVVDTMLSAMDNAYDACDDYLNDPGANPYSALVPQLDGCLKSLQEQSALVQALPQDLKDTLSATKISIADAEALAGMAGTLRLSYEDSIGAILYIMDPEHPYDISTRRKALSIYRGMADDDAGIIFLGTCELLLPIDESALFDTRTEFFTSLKVLSGKLQLWSRDETSLKSQQDSLYEHEKSLLNDLAMACGNLDRDFLSEKEALISMLTAGGMTKEQANEYVNSILDKSQSLENSQKQLDDLNQQLDAQYEEARRKFAPQDSDTAGALWNKSMRFHKLRMYDDAVNCLQHFMIKQKEVDANATVFVPAAIKFIQQIGKTGIDNGVLVVGYEENQRPHSVLKIGDVIVGLNGEAVAVMSDYTTKRDAVPAGEGFTVTVLRDDGTGMLKLADLAVPAGEPKIFFLDFVEQ